MTIETMAFYHNYDKSNTTGGTNGAGNVYPSGAPQITLGFSGVRVNQSFYIQ
jgi:hypothetical protein